MYRVFFSFIFIGFWCAIHTQRERSPCSDYFNYETDSSGTYGVIMLQPFGHPVFNVTVIANFTIAASRKSFTHAGSLKPVFTSKHLLQDFNRGVPLKYQVNFPVTSPLTKITSLTVNDNVICYATGERPGEAQNITKISMRHTLYYSTRKSRSTGVYEVPPPQTQSTDVYEVLPPQTQRPTTFYAPKLSEPRQRTPSKSVYGEIPQQIPTSTTKSPQKRKRTRPTSSRPINTDSTSSSMECGMDNSPSVPLIINGFRYDRGEIPWLVAIFKIQEFSSLLYVCSGTLVSATHVISAAHCIKRGSLYTSVKKLVVKTGVYDLEDWSDDITVTRTLKAAVIHEAYNATTLANDLLVMTLEKPVPFGTYIKPACLWSGNPNLNRIVGKSGVVAGWGKNELGKGGSGEPRMVRMPIVSTETCRASKPVFFQLTSTSKTLCAGNRDGSGPCSGDSGGGLYILYKGRWRLRGVVSLALKSDDGYDCDLAEYVVFTDTAQYLPWINKVMSD